MGEWVFKTTQTPLSQNSNHLQEELDGIDLEKIWTYDKSNLQDDTGDKKIITKSGAKHPEMLKMHPKRLPP